MHHVHIAIKNQTKKNDPILKWWTNLMETGERSLIHKTTMMLLVCLISSKIIHELFGSMTVRLRQILDAQTDEYTRAIKIIGPGLSQIASKVRSCFAIDCSKPSCSLIFFSIFEGIWRSWWSWLSLCIDSEIKIWVNMNLFHFPIILNEERNLWVAIWGCLDRPDL